MWGGRGGRGACACACGGGGGGWVGGWVGGGGGGGVILGEVKARPKDIISFSLDYISKSKVQTSNPSSSPISLDTPARPADFLVFLAPMISTAKVVSLRFCLHIALVFFGAGETVSSLIEAAADINEQLRIPPSRVTWWTIVKMLHARHHFSPSALTYLAYHHYGATPLIVSILALEQSGWTLDFRRAFGAGMRNANGWKTAYLLFIYLHPAKNTFKMMPVCGLPPLQTFCSCFYLTRSEIIASDDLVLSILSHLTVS